MNNSLKIIRFLIPVIILGILGGIAITLIRHPPEAERIVPPDKPLMTVNTMTLHRAPYRIGIQSYGNVRPRTKSILVAQVAGQIVSINPNLREGGFFEEGEQLLAIDPRDYIADVKIAEAALMDARQELIEEQARSEQALRDWNRLGNKGQATDLVLRKPQLLAAESRVISAESALTKARLSLERTRIIAPYAGRVLRKMVDVGQVVSMNTLLAEVYASDAVEIRLPIRNRDLAFIDLPESYRYEENSTEGPDVTIFSELEEGQTWTGRVVRTESAIDDKARQLHVVVQIDDPFDKGKVGFTPIKIGQYVTAELKGKLVEAGLVIPNQAIYQGSYVYIVKEDVLQRRNIEIAWQNNEDSLVRSGLMPGEELVLTPLGQVTSGLRVMISKTGENLTMEPSP